MPNSKKKMAKHGNTRRIYSAPHLRKVQLHTEEVMGVGCKATPVSLGQAGETCVTQSCSATPGS